MSDHEILFSQKIEFFLDQTIGIMISDMQYSPGALDAFLKVVKKSCVFAKATTLTILTFQMPQVKILNLLEHMHVLFKK